MDVIQFTDPVILVAYANALDAIRGVDKAAEADTGKYKYKFQTLDDVIAEVKRVLRDNGLTLTQIPGGHDGILTMTNVLIDRIGNMLMLAPMELVAPREAQALGSAVTYLKRYSLVSQFVIATGEDDDGHAATVAAQVQPGRRTEAERLIREAMVPMTADQRKTFATDFKGEFGSTLTDLPANRHGQALTWSREWIAAWIDPEQAALQELRDAGMEPQPDSLGIHEGAQ